ncbi:MAG: hypothetical protein A2992_09685 [Elusimicrobia bacterium RIFCSPLOWO2_01_FULL_59_12]|nr:MAG: hypothetical protein A2992_09685 [Elusimicrobia bacterium RIFCSPLOWO2_01_FULL_59_12]
MAKTVLVIDDDPSFLRFLNFHLVKSGYQVVTVDGAEQAMKILFNQPVDLVLTDMRMPQLDGCDIVYALKQSYPKIPVLVCSAHPESNRLEQALRFTDVRFVRKPFMIEDIFSAINDLIKN